MKIHAHLCVSLTHKSLYQNKLSVGTNHVKLRDQAILQWYLRYIVANYLFSARICPHWIAYAARYDKYTGVRIFDYICVFSL